MPVDFRGNLFNSVIEAGFRQNHLSKVTLKVQIHESNKASMIMTTVDASELRQNLDQMTICVVMEVHFGRRKGQIVFHKTVDNGSMNVILAHDKISLCSVALRIEFP